MKENYQDIKPELISKFSDQCKGLVFRGYSSTFFSNGRIERREGIRILKSKSCPGCDNKCSSHILEDIHDDLDMDILVLPSIEDGKLYFLEYKLLSTDEYGNVDDYEISIIKESD